MSKKEIENKLSYGMAHLIYRDTPNIIIGKIITLLEVAGLSEKQEKSMKDLIEQSVWNIIRNDGITVSDETHTKLREQYYKNENEARIKNEPPKAI